MSTPAIRVPHSRSVLWGVFLAAVPLVVPVSLALGS